jgi:hypothetical protein
MPVTVQVPHGMAWCAGGRHTIESEGATLRELWDNLHAACPELMWRLSTEQGTPSFWVRVALDGTRLEVADALDTEIPDGAEVVLSVVSGAPAGATL